MSHAIRFVIINVNELCMVYTIYLIYTIPVKSPVLKMEVAIVLIILKPASDEEVLRKLRKIEGVSEAHFLYGPYDAYAKIESHTQKGIHEIVFDKIRAIKDIRSTMTCLIAD